MQTHKTAMTNHLEATMSCVSRHIHILCYIEIGNAVSVSIKPYFSYSRFNVIRFLFLFLKTVRRQDMVLWTTFMHEKSRVVQFVSLVSEHPIYDVFTKHQINFVL